MTDPDLTPAEGDTPGPFATPAQDADVRALLGTLRAEDVPMPDDVLRRINAAVVAERLASTLPDSPAALVDAEDEARGGASVTVLPTAEERRGPSYRSLSTLLAAAAAVVVVVGVGAMITRNGGLGVSSTTSAGAASQAPETAAGGSGKDASGVTVSDSGAQYAASSLADQAARLVREPAPVVATPETLSTVDSPSVATPAPTRGTDSHASSIQPAVLDRCVQLITSTPNPPAPVAVDSGTYEGKPALVLVLPTEDDPASLDVYVVAPTCGSGGEPPLYQFLRIARP